MTMQSNPNKCNSNHIPEGITCSSIVVLQHTSIFDNLLIFSNLCKYKYLEFNEIKKIQCYKHFVINILYIFCMIIYYINK